MIQAKIRGEEIVEVSAAQQKAPVIDILEALKMSLDQVKKPVRSATGVAAKAEASAEEPKAKKPRKSSGG